MFQLDARTRLKEELQKGPCRRVQTGLPCKFGDECRFSHLQPYELDQLKYDGMLFKFSHFLYWFICKLTTYLQLKLKKRWPV